MSRVGNALQQFSYLKADFVKVNRKRKVRWLTCWFMPAGIALVQYRLSRFGLLLLGPSYRILFTLLIPLRFFVRPWLMTHCEIDPAADIGPGFTILHPSLGVVISRQAIAGANLILVGGNCIGVNTRVDGKNIIIGDNVLLGASANVIGYVTIGNQVQIGAGAVVVKDVADNQTVGGVPARPIGESVS